LMALISAAQYQRARARCPMVRMVDMGEFATWRIRQSLMEYHIEREAEEEESMWLHKLSKRHD
jgi:hypothetical protein